MASNSGTQTSVRNIQGNSKTEIADEYVEGNHGTGISVEYIKGYSGPWISDESGKGAYIMQKSGFRFFQGIRSITMLIDLMEEYSECGERTARALQEYSHDWTKKLTDLSYSGNGGVWNGSIYSSIAKVLMEPMEDAKIYNLVKTKGFDNDGPVTFLRSWKTRMEGSQIPKETVKLYTTAWKKQISSVLEIQKAMEYYHWRKYKLETGLRLLQADPPILPFRAEENLRKSILRYLDKCQNTQEQYKTLLIMEKAGRGQRMADIRTAKLKFGRFEKKRMMNTEVGIEKFLNVLEKLDTERANHQGLLQDIHAILDKMDIEIDVRNLLIQKTNQHEYPVFVEFDEKTLYQKHEIKKWLKSEKLRALTDVVIKRKRNKQCNDPTVVIADESDPSLVKEIILYDDTSDDVKEGTYFDQIVDEYENEESETEIFEIDEKGREIKLKQIPKPMTVNVRAHGNHKKPIKGTVINVKAAPTTGYFSQHNATESINENGMWAIPTRIRTIDIDVERDTSSVPSKLTRKEMQLVKKTRKDTDTEVRNVAEVTTLSNVKVIATEDYIARNKDELTLKAGKKIKQKVPANSDGMAYGWTRKWKLRRKIYGYYPASLVELRPKKQKTGIRRILSKERDIRKFES
ncbi:hypothetical protein ACJMK2_029206 [Sinanodonta woodiana]|uniref:Uncharacterized protein n=1 Tax=Sinanodonta woodiana TaxID=1069815 RepID=A0ABD3X9G0_SINWO